MIERWGKTVTILRDAQNITEKRSIVRSFNSKLQTSPILQEMSYFRWDSELRQGDIFQDVFGQERSLVVAIEFLGTDAVKDGLRVTALRCNDSVILYEIIPTGAQNEFGKKRYNDTVRVNDFAFVYQSVQGDQLVPIGELQRGETMIVFSARKLLGYVPKEGNRCVLLDGKKYQIDGVDSHLYPGCFKVLTSPDQRVE